MPATAARNANAIDEHGLESWSEEIKEEWFIPLYKWKCPRDDINNYSGSILNWITKELET